MRRDRTIRMMRATAKWVVLLVDVQERGARKMFHVRQAVLSHWFADIAELTDMKFAVNTA